MMRKHYSKSLTMNKTTSLDKVQEIISELNFEDTISFLQDKVK